MLHFEDQGLLLRKNNKVTILYIILKIFHIENGWNNGCEQQIYRNISWCKTLGNPKVICEWYWQLAIRIHTFRFALKVRFARYFYFWFEGAQTIDLKWPLNGDIRERKHETFFHDQGNFVTRCLGMTERWMPEQFVQSLAFLICASNVQFEHSREIANLYDIGNSLKFYYIIAVPLARAVTHKAHPKKF